MLRTQPLGSALSEPWFAAANEGRLLLQRCTSCGHHQFYPRIVCTRCSAPEPEWVEASGKGVVASFTVVRHAVSGAYAAPYVVALVDLSEGPRMMSNIIACEPGDVRIGHAVQVCFEQWDDDVALPVFTLAPSTENRLSEQDRTESEVTAV